MIYSIKFAQKDLSEKSGKYYCFFFAKIEQLSLGIICRHFFRENVVFLFKITYKMQKKNSHKPWRKRQTHQRFYIDIFAAFCMHSVNLAWMGWCLWQNYGHRQCKDQLNSDITRREAHSPCTWPQDRWTGKCSCVPVNVKLVLVLVSVIFPRKLICKELETIMVRSDELFVNE